MSQQSQYQCRDRIDVSAAISSGNPSRAINGCSSICSRRPFEFHFHISNHRTNPLYSRSQFFLAHAEFVAPASYLVNLIYVDVVAVRAPRIAFIVRHWITSI
jgi:hypothetical protein